MEEKPECKCKAFLSKFRNSPHFFKPLQVLIAIAILICNIFIYYGYYTELYWQTALGCLLMSGAASITFALGIQHKLVKRYSCGLLTWSAVEFLYSVVLAFFSGYSAVTAFDRALWDYGAEFIVFVVLFVFLTISYAVSVFYIAREELKILMEKDGVPMTNIEKAGEKTEYINDLEKFLDD